MKPRNYIPLGRLISDVLIKSDLVDHLISLNLMEDVIVDVGQPLSGRNLKSMSLIDKVIIKPTKDTSWEALKDQRDISNEMYLFSKIDPPEVMVCYHQDLEAQGIDLSGFSLDWLPDHPPNSMKRKREPSEKKKKKKSLKLGESSATQKKYVPLSSLAPGKSQISEAPFVSGSRQIISSLPQPPPPSLHMNQPYLYPYFMNLKLMNLILLTLTHLHLPYPNSISLQHPSS